MIVLNRVVALLFLLFYWNPVNAGEAEYDHVLTWSYWEGSNPQDFAKVEFKWDGKSVGFGKDALRILNDVKIQQGDKIRIDLETRPHAHNIAGPAIATTKVYGKFIFKWIKAGAILTHYFDGKRYETHSLMRTNLYAGFHKTRVLFDGKDLGSELEAEEILKKLPLSEPCFILWFRPSGWWQEYNRKYFASKRDFEALRDREGEGKLYFDIINVEDIEYFKYEKSVK